MTAAVTYCACNDVSIIVVVVMVVVVGHAYKGLIEKPQQKLLLRYRRTSDDIIEIDFRKTVHLPRWYCWYWQTRLQWHPTHAKIYESQAT